MAEAIEPLTNITDLAAYQEYLRLNKANDWQNTLHRTGVDKDKIAPTAYNAYAIAKHDPGLKSALAFNDLTKTVVLLKEIHSRHTTINPDSTGDALSLMDSIGAYVDDEYRVNFNGGLLKAQVLKAARENHTFNPIIDRLNAAHEAWMAAGKPTQLNKIFVDTLGAEDNKNTALATKIFFSGLVMRAHEPGTKFDFMTILYSKAQNIGKSTLLAKLAGDFYLGALGDLSNKETWQNLNGRWIANDDELAAVTDRKNSFPTVKAFITTTTDSFRPPFGQLTLDYPRTAVLAGTSNELNILRDATGNRRLTIVTCGVNPITKPVSKLTENDILLYLGEAEEWYRTNQCELFTDAEQQKILDHGKSVFEAVDTEKETLLTVLNAMYPANWWNLDKEAQRQYVAHIIDGEGDKNTLPGVKQLDRVNIRWLLSRAFKIDLADGRNTGSKLQSKLSTILNSLPGWEKSASKIRFGQSGSTTGYKRI